MKVAFAENNVLGSKGLDEKSTFKLAATAHAFKMLSSGLYSDKIRAVLREIGCNATDAHIAAGMRDKPIRVKLPNVLDDQFYIQDWGPGLSHDEVMGLYTTYFASSKQTSNDFTGAFGLGSKSPFSYIDSFSVVSCHGGTKRTYSLYLNNSGAPEVALMGEEPVEADWQTGVRVGFAVKPDDYAEFQEKAQQVFQWFATTPEVRGSQAIKPAQYKYSCNDYHLLKEGTEGIVWALMGNVAYPVKLDSLKVIELNWNASEKEKGKLLNYLASVKGLVLRMPIGSVQVAASREELQYDVESLKALKLKAANAVEDLGKDVVAALRKALSGTWDDKCSCHDIIDTMLSGISYRLSDFLQALGVTGKEAVDMKAFASRDAVEMPALAAQFTIAKYATSTPRGKSKAYVYHLRPGGKDSIGRIVRVAIEPETVVAWGYADQVGGRLKQAILDGKYKQIIGFGYGGKTRPSAGDIEAEALEVATKLGGVPVIDLLTLPAPVRAPGAKSKKKPKGWVPTLPVGDPYKIIRLDGNKPKADLADLGTSDPLYMCRMDTSKWGSSNSYARFYKTTAEDDIRIDWDTWESIWNFYCGLQGIAQLPNAPQSYAQLSAVSIRKIQIPQLGWKLANEALVEYLQRPELKQELKKKITKKHLLAAESWNVGAGAWMQGLAWWVNAKGAALEGLLRKRKLWDTLQQMIAARKAVKGKGEPAIPVAIQHYQQLVRLLNMADELAGDVRDAMTIDDLDAAFNKRFPLASFFSAPVVLREDDHAQEIIEFILSKEV